MGNASTPLPASHPKWMFGAPASVLPFEPATQNRRQRIWDLSANLHCSIVGTCLTTGDLRHLFAKLGQADAKTMSDHALHHQGVQAAGQGDLAGKLLNKMLEKRHATFVKRFSKAKSSHDLAVLWREAMTGGDIPGAYWAVLTHPLSDDALVKQVFGDVHMLSHLVGMSNRVDISRLRLLEAELAARDEKIARQEARLRQMSLEHAERHRRLEALEAELLRRKAQDDGPPQPPAGSGDADRQLLLASQRLERANGRIREQKAAALAGEARIHALEETGKALSAELQTLQTVVAELTARDDDRAILPDLGGLRLLYVGGRPGQVDQARALAARFGGILLSHDGGIEDSAALLPGLVSQSDAALFPVDCISHHAAGQIKKLCGEAGKPFLPLRSASLSSFAAAVGSLKSAGVADAGGH